ncbi:MAG: hypothetical protein ABIO70_19430, partial [Pseudomonadota bacterium]
MAHTYRVAPVTLQVMACGEGQCGRQDRAEKAPPEAGRLFVGGLVAIAPATAATASAVATVAAVTAVAPGAAAPTA